MKRPPKQSGAQKRAPTQKSEPSTVWLFGLHAVRDALINPSRVHHRLILTQNARDRLGDFVSKSNIAPQIVDARAFPAPLDPQSVHQGAALEVDPLSWDSVSEICAPHGQSPVVILLDRVTDPHNVGAVLRSAEVFGARAVIGPHRHSAPETGALAKAASGALERQPYLRVPNLARAMASLHEMGYVILGMDGEAETEMTAAISGMVGQPLAIALGAEGPGLRQLTKDTCDQLVAIRAAGGFGSLNVSNAAAVALYAAANRAN